MTQIKFEVEIILQVWTNNAKINQDCSYCLSGIHNKYLYIIYFDIIMKFN